MSEDARRFEEDLAAVAIEMERHRKSAAILRTEVLPLVEGLVVLLEGELRSCGERKAKELTRYVQPIRAIQYILHNRLDG